MKRTERPTGQVIVIETQEHSSPDAHFTERRDGTRHDVAFILRLAKTNDAYVQTIVPGKEWVIVWSDGATDSITLS